MRTKSRRQVQLDRAKSARQGKRRPRVSSSGLIVAGWPGGSGQMWQSQLHFALKPRLAFQQPQATAVLPSYMYDEILKKSLAPFTGPPTRAASAAAATRFYDEYEKARGLTQVVASPNP